MVVGSSRRDETPRAHAPSRRRITPSLTMNATKDARFTASTTLLKFDMPKMFSRIVHRWSYGISGVGGHI